MAKKKIVVSTGAGMSAESGISTFRDAGGLWEQYPVMDVASAEGFARNPALGMNFTMHAASSFSVCSQMPHINCLPSLKRITMWRLSRKMWIICMKEPEAQKCCICMAN